METIDGMLCLKERVCVVISRELSMEDTCSGVITELDSVVNKQHNSAFIMSGKHECNG